MTEDPHSGRAKARAGAKARRNAKSAFRQSSFDFLASGYSLEQIAEARKVGIRTIQREIDSVIAARRLDAPERYVHLQVARLTKALRLTDVAIERGDLKAVQALVQVVNSLDRYHGLRGLEDPAKAGSSAVSAPPVAALPSAASRPDPRPCRSRARAGRRTGGRCGNRDVTSYHLLILRSDVQAARLERCSRAHDQRLFLKHPSTRDALHRGSATVFDVKRFGFAMGFYLLGWR